MLAAQCHFVFEELRAVRRHCGRQGSETAGKGWEKQEIGRQGSEKGTERYVHRGGLSTWAGKLLGTYFSVPFSPFSPAAAGRLGWDGGR
jgi:hypothetical protein